MPTGMGVVDPKLVKGGRKLKKAKYYTIPKPRTNMKKKRAYGAELKIVVEKKKPRRRKCRKMHPTKLIGAFEMMLLA